jgi:flagellar motor protein MotB
MFGARLSCFFLFYRYAEVGFFSMIDGTDERASYASDDRLAFEVDGTKGRRVSEVFGQPAKEAAVVNGAPPPPSHYQQPQQPQQQQQQRQQQQQYQQQAQQQQAQQQQAQQQQYQQPHYQQPQMPQAQPQPFNIVGEFGFQVNFFGEWQQGRAGPGGLDPVQVLQALPPDLTQAFQHRSNAQLKAALRRLALPDVQYYMKGCVDAGLWINPAPREQRLGPGGLDPLEILERLPPSIVEAFQARDRAQLNTALGALSQAELDQYIEACVNAGLWTVPR